MLHSMRVTSTVAVLADRFLPHSLVGCIVGPQETQACVTASNFSGDLVQFGSIPLRFGRVVSIKSKLLFSKMKSRTALPVGLRATVPIYMSCCFSTMLLSFLAPNCWYRLV